MTDRRSDYVAAVAGTLARLHAKRFHRLWTEPTREGEWCGRFQITQNLAFQFAVLHHFEPDPARLELARKYLFDLDRGYHFTSLFCGRAYELLRRRLTASERRDFGRRWVGDVQRQLETYVLRRVEGRLAALRRWDNVSNHALCACVYADYARALFPEESRPHRFERVTDRVWEVWWARREFQEQASNYEGFSACFLCAWADLRGVADAFYRSPSVRNLMARNQRTVSPAGIVAAYGDSGHMEHATAWVALFERVAAGMRDGGLKQAAQDVFGCLRALGLGRAARATEGALKANPYNGRVLYAQHLHAMSWLAMAALWSDPTLRPAPRDPQAGINARLPHGYRLKAGDRKKLPEKKLVPCQVALTGGSRNPKRRSYLLLSVGPELVHDHADAGSILLLSRGNTCLLGTNGYLQRDLIYHHTFYAQPSAWARFPEDGHDRIRRGDRACRGQVEDLEVGEESSCCRVRFEGYHGLPVTLRREVALDRDGVVTLLDRVTAHEKGLCGGVLFHAERIRRLSEGVYRLRTDTLRSMCGMTFTNAPGSLRVTLVHPGAEAGVVSPSLPAIYAQPVYRGFPCCHYTKVWRRSYTARRCLYTRKDLTPGKETLFITRLTPEG